MMIEGVGGLRFVSILLLVLTACLPDEPKQNTAVEIADPSARKCIEDGHQFTIRTNPDGSQTGICIINGKECDAWEYLRGGCK